MISFFFFNGQRFCYFKKLEKLDLAPIPRVSDGRPRCIVRVARSAGSEKENEHLLLNPRCQSGEMEFRVPGSALSLDGPDQGQLLKPKPLGGLSKVPVN